MACTDFWHWVPARLNLACGGSPPDFTSSQVAGHLVGQLSDTLVIKPDWMVGMPWTSSQERNLVSAQIYCISFPPGHLPIRVRGAIYRSRGERCGYPGARVMDLGMATVTAMGAWAFEDGDTGPLPSCELCWVVTWYEYSLHLTGLTDPSSGVSRAWPVLQFGAPGDYNPRCAWGLSHPFQPPDEAAWPDPFEAGGLPLDQVGRREGDPDPIGLPAVYMLQS